VKYKPIMSKSQPYEQKVPSSGNEVISFLLSLTVNGTAEISL